VNALVTGATGFLGSHLARALAGRGHRVRALVRSTSNLQRLDRHKIETVTGSLEDFESLRRAVRGQDIVFNNAGRVVEWGSRADFYRVNVDGTENLLNACLAAGIKRFVHTSSLTVLGIPLGTEPLSEVSPYTERHFEFYTETKIVSEKLVLDFCAREHIPAVIIRPGVIWGPEDTTIFPRLEKLARKGLIFNIGSGDNILCLSYISNVVDALLLAAETPDTGVQIYNITDDEKVTSRTFFYELACALGYRPPTCSVPYRILNAAARLCETYAKIFTPASPPFISRYGLALMGCNGRYDISKARTRLGYEPRVSFRQGVDNIARWYKKKAV